MYGCNIHDKGHEQDDLFDSGVHLREIINMFLVSQVSGLVENINTGIFSGTISVINVKHCMMALLIELYHFSDFDHVSKSQPHRTVLTENFMFISN